MPEQVEIKKVALLGADGNLGPAILSALIAAKFTVTVIKRESSTSPDKYPSGVPVVRIPDAFAVADIVPALKGQDAVIASLRGGQASADLQLRLADAAVQAGVRRFIPADFGSCDSASDMTQRLVPLYIQKTQVREHCKKLVAAQTGGETEGTFSWTSLVCGHFFDWSLQFIHLYPEERRADVLDDGNTKFSISTLARIAEGTVAVLQRPEQTRNRMLYIQSFCVTQREIIAAFERATGGNPWKVGTVESKEFEKVEKAKADAGDKEAVEELVWLLGTIDADWTTRGDGFAMELLGLKDQDLDEETRKVIENGAK